MARPDLPDKLAIIFDPDNFDAWRYLANRHLYLPTGAKTAANVAAIGLTGNLGVEGPIGNYWTGGNAILVMNAADVRRLNRLAPVYYDNLDAMITDHFRAIRRIVGQSYVSQVHEYSVFVAAALGSKKFFHNYEKYQPQNTLDFKLGYALAPSTIPVGTFWKQSFDAFAARGPHRTFARMQQALNRFAPEAAESAIAHRAGEPDSAPAFFLGLEQGAIGKELRAYREPGKNLVPVTLGEFRQGIALARQGIPANVSQYLEKDIRREAGSFSYEVEWMANPTFDRATRGYSVFLNIPPGSLFYLIGRTIKREMRHLLPMSVGGIWTVSIPDDSQRFEDINAAVEAARHGYFGGDLDIDGMYATVKRLGAELLGPNIYWSTRRTK